MIDMETELSTTNGVHINVAINKSTSPPWQSQDRNGR